jgi:hypothetical protein
VKEVVEAHGKEDIYEEESQTANTEGTMEGKES